MVKKQFVIVLATLLFATVSVSHVFAQENSSPTMAALTPEVTAQPTEVDYTLPYPGLLPDSPLYFLKTFRDKIVSFFISDPLKKAEFDLLQSDKRLNSAVYLVHEGKDKETLAHTTISKGDNYYEDGIGQMRQAKTQGESAYDIARTYNTSALKHQEVLQQLEQNASSNFKTDLTSEEKRIEDLRKQVLGLGYK